jgi:hypothetical protein
MRPTSRWRQNEELSSHLPAAPIHQNMYNDFAQTV